MAIPELSAFNLAGGTSMALQMGHRESVDLDLFGNCPFEPSEILQSVSVCGKVTILHQTRNILMLNIEGVKVEIVNYQYELLKEPQLTDELRLLSLEDISTMKLAAITGRGKKRDFFDLYFLMQKFSLSEIFGFYRKKYPDGNVWLVSRSITYFDDADNDLDIKPFDKTSWKAIKNHIVKAAETL
jgi:hypothetical protein